jgi:hypothetical protein
MCEAVDFFRQALAEEGLDGEVKHVSDEWNDKFCVTKQLGDDTITVTVDVDATSVAENYPRKKRIAIAARRVADEFEEYVTERFKWRGRSIEVRPYGEPEASCSTCGASVELPATSSHFTNSAEMSSPHPTPLNFERSLESMDDNSRVLLKMYLAGKLRVTCDYSCPNSKYYDDDLYAV